MIFIHFFDGKIIEMQTFKQKRKINNRNWKPVIFALSDVSILFKKRKSQA